MWDIVRIADGVVVATSVTDPGPPPDSAHCVRWVGPTDVLAPLRTKPVADWTLADIALVLKTRML
jgi:hypothetical protein